MTTTKDNILLTGFRATGKTLVGNLLAEKLGYRFLDTDLEICNRSRMSVAEIVKEKGWEGFRELERAILEEMTRISGVVVAVGGGAIEHRQIWDQLRGNFFIVWLQADVHTILQRMANDENTKEQRPSLTEKNEFDEVQQLLQHRTPLYRAGSDIVLDTVRMTPEMLAEEVITHMMELR